MREVARGDKPYLRKSTDRKITNQEGVRSVQRTDLCFAILLIFSGKVFTLGARTPRSDDRDVDSKVPRQSRPGRRGLKCLDFLYGKGNRGKIPRGFSQLWEDSVTSVTMAFARLVDRRRAGVKSFLPVCHKADWPSSSIRCDPLLFGLSSRLCFLVCLSYQCLKTIQKIEKGKKRLRFLGMEPRLSIDEAWEWLSSSARTYFDLKMEKIPRTQYCWAVGLVLSGVDNFSTRTCSKRRGKV